jgi:hypothetical protein
MPHDGGVDEHEQRLGDERAQRRDGERQDLAVDAGPRMSDR